MIEPNSVFTRVVARVDRTAKPDSGLANSGLSSKPKQLEYNAPPSSAWPIPKTRDGKIRPAWHLDDDYSELASAARRVAQHGGRARVRVGILDNGFSSLHQGLPERLLDDKRGDAVNRPISSERPSIIGQHRSLARNGDHGLVSWHENIGL